MKENDSELRDIFAILSLHALIINKGYEEGVCAESYKIADQMLTEREK